MPRASRHHPLYMKDIPIVVFTGKGEVKGNWIILNCNEPNCKKQLTYWSVSGNALEKYNQSKCEDHR